MKPEPAPSWTPDPLRPPETDTEIEGYFSGWERGYTAGLSAGRAFVPHGNVPLAWLPAAFLLGAACALVAVGSFR